MARPSVFKPEFVEQARKLAAIFGADDARIASFFEVSVRTIYRWKVDHPEFCQALKLSKEVADQIVEDSLYRRATGYQHEAMKIVVVGKQVRKVSYIERLPPDPTSMIFWLKNRQPEKWRADPLPGDGDTPVTPAKVVIEVKDARRR